MNCKIISYNSYNIYQNNSYNSYNIYQNNPCIMRGTLANYNNIDIDWLID